MKGRQAHLQDPFLQWFANQPQPYLSATSFTKIAFPSRKTRVTSNPISRAQPEAKPCGHGRPFSRHPVRSSDPPPHLLKQRETRLHRISSERTYIRISAVDVIITQCSSSIIDKLSHAFLPAFPWLPNKAAGSFLRSAVSPVLEGGLRPKRSGLHQEIRGPEVEEP